MTRDDPVMGTVRLCSVCGEWWPADGEFFQLKPDGRFAGRQCRACRADRDARRPIPTRPRNHGTSIDWERRRAKDRERKRLLRLDPVFGDKLRARQREAQRRFYERNRLAMLERRREQYARAVGHPPTPGIGRPRIAA